METKSVLVYKVEDILKSAYKHVGANFVSNNEFSIDDPSWAEWHGILGHIESVRASIELVHTRMFLMEHLIGKCGPSYYFIPEVEDSSVPYCIIEYPDGLKYVVDFYC
jgi:hypothetical protein